MFKKIIAGFLVLATSTLFGMSLNQLNSASKAELMEINGIGEAKASAILKERKKGQFKSFKDFQRVEGIGEQTATNVKNNVKKKASKRQDKVGDRASKRQNEVAKSKKEKVNFCVTIVGTPAHMTYIPL